MWELWTLRRRAAWWTTSMFRPSGYLTIKKFNPIMQSYQLDYPNKEVRVGMIRSLAPNYLSPIQLNNNSFVFDFLEQLYDGNMDCALQKMQSNLAGISNWLSNKNEKDFQTVFYLIFNLLFLYLQIVFPRDKGLSVLYSP